MRIVKQSSQTFYCEVMQSAPDLCASMFLLWFGGGVGWGGGGGGGRVGVGVGVGGGVGLGG